MCYTRHVAHGEILGVSLLMEDVLLSGHQDASLMKGETITEEEDVELQEKPTEIKIKAKTKGKLRPITFRKRWS